jgi:hypothetical protein
VRACVRAFVCVFGFAVSGIGFWRRFLGCSDFEAFLCVFHATGFASDWALGFKVWCLTCDVD